MFWIQYCTLSWGVKGMSMSKKWPKMWQFCDTWTVHFIQSGYKVIYIKPLSTKWTVQVSQNGQCFISKICRTRGKLRGIWKINHVTQFIIGFAEEYYFAGFLLQFFLSSPDLFLFSLFVANWMSNDVFNFDFLRNQQFFSV